MQLPIGVFGVAIATATLPSISRDAALEEMDSFRETIGQSVRLALLLTVPSAVGLAVLGRPIVALIYERGTFTPNDTAHTADALACYAVGLAGYAAVKILAPAFYAIGNTRTPMMISLVMIAVNFFMNWSLVTVLQERGLALSTSAVSLANFLLLHSILSRRVRGLEDRKTGIAVVKILLASAAMAVACWQLNELLGSPSGRSLGVKLGIVLLQIGSGAVVFYVSALALRVEELSAASRMFSGMLRRLARSR
jgi:putative peptidoglycan lipid II flippase